MLSLNFGTFGSKRADRAWGSEPIVCASIVSSQHDNTTEAMEVTSLVYHPRNEYQLLHRLWELLETENNTHVWFYGYGEDKFDLPYLLERSRRYGLQMKMNTAITRHPNIDLYDIAKTVSHLPQDHHLTIEECTRRFGLTYGVPEWSFKDLFKDWLDHSNPKAIWTTELSSILVLRLANLLKSNLRCNPRGC